MRLRRWTRTVGLDLGSDPSALLDKRRSAPIESGRWERRTSVETAPAEAVTIRGSKRKSGLNILSLFIRAPRWKHGGDTAVLAEADGVHLSICLLTSHCFARSRHVETGRQASGTIPFQRIALDSGLPVTGEPVHAIPAPDWPLAEIILWHVPFVNLLAIGAEMGYAQNRPGPTFGDLSTRTSTPDQNGQRNVVRLWRTAHEPCNIGQDAILDLLRSGPLRPGCT